MYAVLVLVLKCHGTAVLHYVLNSLVLSIDLQIHFEEIVLKKDFNLLNLEKKIVENIVNQKESPFNLTRDRGIVSVSSD